MKKIRYMYNTLKHMNFAHFYNRIKYEVFKRIRKRIKQINKKTYTIQFKSYHSDYNICSNENDILKANNIVKNKFCFLNIYEHQFVNNVDWKSNPFNYRLWNFNLNYFDYLQDLITAYTTKKDVMYLEKGLSLIDDWITQNIDVYDPNLWDPYVVSKRLINWILYFDFISKYTDFEINEKYLRSLHTKLQYLKENPEYYLRANHLIMDGKGLVIGGVFLEDKEAVSKGLFILRTEYEEQVMRDDFHYERTTSYHVEVLEHYVTVYLVLLRNEYIDEANEIKGKLNGMFVSLYNIIMPNGEIPLLNDSTLDYPIKANDLLESAAILFNDPKYIKYSGSTISIYNYKLFGEQGLKVFNGLKPYLGFNETNVILKDSGYYIIKDRIKEGDLYLLFDCGDCGPDYNLAHAHADSLNVILTIGNKKFLEDSGTYTYQISSERDYYRSTAAHNTVTIDEKSSSQVWKAFRVAKRAKSKMLTYSDNETFTIISAEHDGYTKVLDKDKIIHNRTVIYFKKHGFLIIDNLYGKINERHSVSLNYYSGENFKKRKQNSIIFDNSNVELETNYPLITENVNISELFSIKKQAKKVNVSKNIDKNNIFVTKVILSDESLLDYEIVDSELIRIKHGEQLYNYFVNENSMVKG
ncbi:alginate lyase family protein [Evansella cellulosilytica]|uniref:Heparinase II/III family protein n=1 Tax=Evansella cellulosilytica (strain ATCC 21833 / DSM 2522 / FERM P-1141 / JCM 9156 / N-4) TaxID=649639 RepID=E6TVL6_EVAC2|nr:alginate lyase family protein [Evansella cellulosilytica]ADU32144.1 Heparinase II/III family protein [Evansella cellulosilytica DSM 2522]